jgi:hypothetical protein
MAQQFLPGDSVRFLHESGGGTVKRVKSNGMVEVEMPDGFEIDYFATQLVLVSRSEGEKKGGHASLPGRMILKTGLGIQAPSLFYVPTQADKAADSMWRVYLINPYDMPIQVQLYDASGDKPVLHFSEELKAAEFVLVADWNPGFPGAYREWVLQVLVKDRNKIHQPFQQKLALKYAGRVPEQKDEVEGFGMRGVLLGAVHLTSENTESRMPEERVKPNRTIREISDHVVLDKHSGRETWKIDLHASELPIDVTGMSASQIFDFQIGFFERKMDEAQFHGVRKMIVVHGIGKGKLKERVTDILKSKDGLHFYDGPVKDFGYGATVVEFFWST